MLFSYSITARKLLPSETLVFLELVFILNRLFTYAGQSVTKDFPGTLFFPPTIKLTDCHLLFKWKSVKSGVKHNLIDLSLLKADNFHWQLILVYAVEASSMAEQAESIVQENKLSDRIKVVNKKAEVIYYSLISPVYLKLLEPHRWRNG